MKIDIDLRKIENVFWTRVHKRAEEIKRENLEKDGDGTRLPHERTEPLTHTGVQRAIKAVLIDERTGKLKNWLL
jgi:hypothetical protein